MRSKKGSRGNRPVPGRNQNLRFETLEARRLLAANILLDFTPDVIPGEYAVDSFAGLFDDSAGARSDSFLDYNNDGTVTEEDSSIAAIRITGRVRQLLEPYLDDPTLDLSLAFVSPLSSGSGEGVGFLQQGRQSDSLTHYVMYVGATAPVSSFADLGFATQAFQGENAEHYGFVFGTELAELLASDDYKWKSNGEKTTRDFTNLTAYAIAHELGHLWGLGHVIDGTGRPDGYHHVMNYPAQADPAQVSFRDDADFPMEVGDPVTGSAVVRSVNAHQEVRNSFLEDANGVPIQTIIPNAANPTIPTYLNSALEFHDDNPAPEPVTTSPAAAAISADDVTALGIVADVQSGFDSATTLLGDFVSEASQVNSPLVAANLVSLLGIESSLETEFGTLDVSSLTTMTDLVTSLEGAGFSVNSHLSDSEVASLDESLPADLIRFSKTISLPELSATDQFDDATIAGLSALTGVDLSGGLTFNAATHFTFAAGVDTGGFYLLPGNGLDMHVRGGGNVTGSAGIGTASASATAGTHSSVVLSTTNADGRLRVSDLVADFGVNSELDVTGGAGLHAGFVFALPFGSPVEFDGRWIWDLSSDGQTLDLNSANSGWDTDSFNRSLAELAGNAIDTLADQTGDLTEAFDDVPLLGDASRIVFAPLIRESLSESEFDRDVIEQLADRSITVVSSTDPSTFLDGSFQTQDLFRLRLQETVSAGTVAEDFSNTWSFGDSDSVASILLNVDGQFDATPELTIDVEFGLNAQGPYVVEGASIDLDVSPTATFSGNANVGNLIGVDASNSSVTVTAGADMTLTDGDGNAGELLYLADLNVPTLLSASASNLDFDADLDATLNLGATLTQLPAVIQQIPGVESVITNLLQWNATVDWDYISGDANFAVSNVLSSLGDLEDLARDYFFELLDQNNPLPQSFRDLLTTSLPIFGSSDVSISSMLGISDFDILLNPQMLIGQDAPTNTNNGSGDLVELNYEFANAGSLFAMLSGLPTDLFSLEIDKSFNLGSISVPLLPETPVFSFFGLVNANVAADLTGDLAFNLDMTIGLDTDGFYIADEGDQHNLAELAGGVGVEFETNADVGTVLEVAEVKINPEIVATGGVRVDAASDGKFRAGPGDAVSVGLELGLKVEAEAAVGLIDFSGLRLQTGRKTVYDNTLYSASFQASQPDQSIFQGLKNEIKDKAKVAACTYAAKQAFSNQAANIICGALIIPNPVELLEKGKETTLKAGRDFDQARIKAFNDIADEAERFANNIADGVTAAVGQFGDAVEALADFALKSLGLKRTNTILHDITDDRTFDFDTNSEPGTLEILWDDRGYTSEIVTEDGPQRFPHVGTIDAEEPTAVSLKIGLGVQGEGITINGPDYAAEKHIATIEECTANGGYYDEYGNWVTTYSCEPEEEVYRTVKLPNFRYISFDELDALEITTIKIVGSGLSDSIVVDPNVPYSFHLSGLDGDDVLEGARGNDTISGGSGDDLIRGRWGNDILTGGDNDDFIEGDEGSDTIDGGLGDDTLIEESRELISIAANVLSGGPGSDYIRGSSNTDIIQGGADRDYIYGEDGDDEIYAYSMFPPAGELEPQGDLIFGGTGSDSIFGSDGPDHLYGESGSDTILGGSGDDFLIGGGDDDEISGGAGQDRIEGRSGSDLLAGQGGADLIQGGDGFDEIYGGWSSDDAVVDQDDEGNDILYGDEGNDVIVVGYSSPSAIGYKGRTDGYAIVYGGPDADEIQGSAAGDWIDGGSGPDRIFGHGGPDQLFTGQGNDFIDAGEGEDVLSASDLGFADRYSAQNVLLGGPDNDKLSGSSASIDVLLGGPGTDLMVGFDGTDRLHIDNDDEIFAGDLANDVYIGHDLVIDDESFVWTTTGDGIVWTETANADGETIEINNFGHDRIHASGQFRVEGTELLILDQVSTLVNRGFLHEYRIVDNDGTDPIDGAFAGLPEGAVATESFPPSWTSLDIAPPTSRANITYVGGDGNDAELILHPLRLLNVAYTESTATLTFTDPIAPAHATHQNVRINGSQSGLLNDVDQPITFDGNSVIVPLRFGGFAGEKLTLILPTDRNRTDRTGVWSIYDNPIFEPEIDTYVVPATGGTGNWIAAETLEYAAGNYRPVPADFNQDHRLEFTQEYAQYERVDSQWQWSVTEHTTANSFVGNLQVGDNDVDGALDPIVAPGNGQIWLDADFDLDGEIERFVATEFDGTSLANFDIDGVRVDPIIEASGGEISTFYGSQSAIGDFDGDGDQDVIILQTDGGLYIDRANNAWVWFNPIRNALPSGETVFPLTSQALTWNFDQIQSLAVADFDDDGLDDVYAVHGDSIHVAKSTGQPAADQVLTWPLMHTLVTNGDVYGGDAADFDGDGDIDLVSSFFDHDTGVGGTYLSFNDGAGGFTTESRYSNYISYYLPVAGDFNSDGSIDLLAGGEIWLNPPVGQGAATENLVQHVSTSERNSGYLGQWFDFGGDDAITFQHDDYDGNDAAIEFWKRTPEGDWLVASTFDYPRSPDASGSAEPLSMAVDGDHSIFLFREYIPDESNYRISLQFYDRQSDGSWGEVRTFHYDGDDASADLSDGRAVLVSPSANGFDTIARTFHQNVNGTWVEEVSRRISDLDSYYDAPVNLDGPILIIGQPSGGANFDGAVHVYTDSGTEWTLQSQVENPTGAYYFGSSIGFEGGVLAVGAEFGADVELFSTTDYQTWSPLQTIVSPVNTSSFGKTIAMSEGHLVIGIPEGIGTNDNSGAARLYAWNETTGKYALQKTYRSPNRLDYDQFGYTDIGESEVWFGAPTTSGQYYQSGYLYQLPITAVDRPNVPVPNSSGSDPDVVTNTNDSGAGSLRAAIEYANANPGPDTITFDIGGAGPHTINLDSELPEIAEALTIDGGAPDDVRLTGLFAGPASDGLKVRSDDVTILGLRFFHFQGDGIDAVGVSNLMVDQVTLLENFGQGIRLSAVSDSTISQSEFRNNGKSGIQITGASSNVTVDSNYIGAAYDAFFDETVPDGNGVYGIHVLAPGNLIQNNVVTDNASIGIAISSATAGGNTLVGNFVGTDANGASGLGNGSFGVLVRSPNNTIGGSTAGDANVISGNSRSGLVISGPDATGNVVQGNFAGTNADGTDSIPNGAYGILLTDADNNTVGGATPSLRNIISGNSGSGLAISNNGSGNTIQSNYIGVNASGFLPLPNGGNGVYLRAGANNNDILGNFIAGNPGSQVSLVAGTTTSNTVSGNMIGFGESFTPISGGTNAILIKAPGNTIGGASATDANYITGSTTGISLNGLSARDNWIANNRIGTDAMLPAGNDFGMTNGVQFLQGSRDNIVGPGNVIAYNTGDGIRGTSGGLGNTFTQNSLFANAFGIDLGANGANANDVGDGDSGANNLQNTATSLIVNLTPTSPTEIDIEFDYFIDSDPTNSQYPLLVEFFVSDSFGQGIEFIDQDLFTEADYIAGFATYTASVSVNDFDVAPEFGTATVTDADGNTSEFTFPGVPVDSPAGSSANSLNLSAAPARSFDARDTDQSGDVTPADALRVINAFANQQRGEAAVLGLSQLDVNGSGTLTPADALMVIDYLSDKARRRSAAVSFIDSVDSVFSGLDDDELLLLELEESQLF